ncbi:MAG: hypothetical protein V3T09_02260 [bacterium]
MKSYLDTGSIIIIVITFVLFGIALFTKGFTHDMLLEVGVFLVSVKLIMMAFKNANHSRKLENELIEIKELLKQK